MNWLKTSKAWLVALVLLTFNPFVSAANDRPTAEEAVAVVKRAVAHFKANGKEKAFADFNDPKGRFVDRSLYIFVYSLDGTCLAIGNGNSSKMVGKNMIDMRDADGTYLIKRLSEVAKTKGSGWVDYKWPNPTNQNVESKTSYVERVDDLFIGSGIYK